jgi:uncharacterized protein YbjT (DUF2867 family)
MMSTLASSVVARRTETKIITVVGGAGATGGGLARAILADPVGGYPCPVITRTPHSPAPMAWAVAMLPRRPVLEDVGRRGRASAWMTP